METREWDEFENYANPSFSSRRNIKLQNQEVQKLLDMNEMDVVPFKNI